MKPMKYNGYTAKVTYSQEDSLLQGKVLNIGNDVICFYGNSRKELAEAFKNVVDSYIEAKQNREVKQNRINLMWIFGQLFSRVRRTLHF